MKETPTTSAPGEIGIGIGIEAGDEGEEESIAHAATAAENKNTAAVRLNANANANSNANSNANADSFAANADRTRSYKAPPPPPPPRIRSNSNYNQQSLMLHLERNGGFSPTTGVISVSSPQGYTLGVAEPMGMFGRHARHGFVVIGGIGLRTALTFEADRFDGGGLVGDGYGGSGTQVGESNSDANPNVSASSGIGRVSDAIEARIDSMVALWLRNRGASDIVCLASKLLLLAAFASHTRFDPLFDNIGFYRALDTALSESTRTSSSFSPHLQQQRQHQQYQAKSQSQSQSQPRKRASSEMSEHQLSESYQLPRRLSDSSVVSSDSTASSPPILDAKTNESNSSDPLVHPFAPSVSPIFYTPQELVELKGTSLEHLIINSYSSFFNSILPLLQATSHGIFSYFANINSAPFPPRTFNTASPLLLPPRIDTSLLTNSAAFRVALSFVLSRAVRVNPSSPRIFEDPRAAMNVANWSVTGAVIGNWQSVLAAGLRRRIPGPSTPNASSGYDLLGPHAHGSSGLLGMEEIFGRIVDTTTKIAATTRATATTFAAAVAEAAIGISSSDSGVGALSLSSPTTDHLAAVQEDTEDWEFRNTWMHQPANTTGSILCIAPFIELLDRRSRSREVELEEEARRRRLRKSQIFLKHAYVQVNYIPQQLYLIPNEDSDLSNGNAIPVNPDEFFIDGNSLPDGYRTFTIQPTFNITAFNPILPGQKWAMMNGGLSNHHLLLSFGTIEENNDNDILDIPIDLIEDAVTSHLEHFGPTTRPLYSKSNLGSSSSSSSSSNNPLFFTSNSNLSVRYLTATERAYAEVGKGKQRARYDVCTYEAARRLLKGMGLFPKDGGVIRCKSEYFYQDETYNTIIQVLLMSAEQFAEYSLEPCILDYNTIFQNTKVVSSPEDSPISTADDPMMSDSSQPLPTPPPPRPNVFPHYYKRNRGRLPTRPGALDAFLVVSCGVLQRRLAMYPTTFLEDQMLLRQITDSMTARYEEWLVANKGGQSNKMDGTVSSAVGGGSGGDANAAECNSRQPYQGAKEDNDAGNDAEFEDRKRRKSENPAKNSTSPNDDYESGGTGEANSMDCEDVTSNGGDESVGTGSAGGADGNDDGTMKVAQSDDTLVSVESGGQINVDAGGVIAKSGTRDKQIANAAAQPKPVRQLPRIILPSVPIKSAVASAPGPTKPATIKPQAQLGWYTSNRIVAIRFRQQEKRSLLTALKFLETMVEKRYASFLLDNNLITSQAERQAKEILVMGGAGAGVQVSPAVFAAANAAAAATAAAAAGVGRNYEVSEEEGEEEEEEEEEMDEVRRDAMADVLEEFEDEEEDDEEGYYYSGSEFGSEYST